MNRITPRTIFAAFGGICVVVLGISFVGCGNGRPPGIADRPGESFIELSDLAVEQAGNDLKIAVHYRFPDGLPHPDAWFTFFFDVNGGKSGTIPVRKQGRELSEEGDMEAVTSFTFASRRKSISFGAKVQQSPNKGGPWHDVSERLAVDF